MLPYDHDDTPFKSTPPLESEGIHSVKWLLWWAFRLEKNFARAIIEGWRFADGSEAMKRNDVFMSSVREREQFGMLALHAGFAYRFYLQQYAGEYSGFVPNAYGDTKGSHAFANYDVWTVCYPDEMTTHKANRLSPGSNPVIKTHQDVIRTIDYTGRVWSVAVPYDYVMVRRAFRDEHGNVTKASKPLIHCGLSAQAESM